MLTFIILLLYQGHNLQNSDAKNDEESATDPPTRFMKNVSENSERASGSLPEAEGVSLCIPLFQFATVIPPSNLHRISGNHVDQGQSCSPPVTVPQLYSKRRRSDRDPGVMSSVG
jgi:hypothetical protein